MARTGQRAPYRTGRFGPVPRRSWSSSSGHRPPIRRCTRAVVGLDGRGRAWRYGLPWWVPRGRGGQPPVPGSPLGVRVTAAEWRISYGVHGGRCRAATRAGLRSPARPRRRRAGRYPVVKTRLAAPLTTTPAGRVPLVRLEGPASAQGLDDDGRAAQRTGASACFDAAEHGPLLHVLRTREGSPVVEVVVATRGRAVRRIGARGAVSHDRRVEAVASRP